MNIEPIEDWLPFNSKPLVISGPCSAESEAQMLTTAKQLAETGIVNIFRAGIWKPRTRPNSFEGIGTQGLVWLQKVKEQYGFITAVEVANANHVKDCLALGVDILWIGARTSANPFSMQEIADAVKGKDIPVFVKNPVNPDLQLWIGALERLNQAGITKLAAIHRGFSSHEHTSYRNVPMWEIPIELMRTYPELKIICDPSHIAGNRQLLPHLSQKAMDLNMHGLMLESHYNPEVALSDKEQQLTPAALKELIGNLTIRNSSTLNKDFADHLTGLRKTIDEIDDEIIMKLVKRMQVAEKIGEYKKENEVTILQVERWEEIISKRVVVGESMGLSEHFMKKLLQIIHKESIRKQTDIMNS
jgi:chorismate mutase